MPGQNPKIKSEISPKQTLKKRKKLNSTKNAHSYNNKQQIEPQFYIKKTWNWSIIKTKRAIKIETYSNMLIWYWA